jgi:hypothetical protein
MLSKGNQLRGVSDVPKVTEITRPYFSHDDDARGDDKIKRLFFSFRKIAKELSQDELESFVSVGAYGIFWSILEYMHRNEFKSHDVELLADELRIDEKFINIILKDFEFFEFEEDCYFSKRMIDDINKVSEKVEKKSDASNKRWGLSYLKKYYEEIFGKTPILGQEDITAYLNYYNTIPEFKEQLPDILFTLKSLKFDNLPNFNPDINWLLKENHLPSLINGEFGKLKNWKEYKALKKQELKNAENLRKGLEIENNLSLEKSQKEQDMVESITNKVDAIEIISQNIKGSINGKLIILPPFSDLMKKFDITTKEIKEHLL